MSPHLAAASVASLALVAVAAGCQTTQDKSAEIAASLGPVAEQVGLKVTEPSKDVEVVDTTVLSSDGLNAVVVELRNTTDEALTNVPILIEVLDASGKKVYSNDFPGIEPALAYVPLIQPKETVAWVHDQVLAATKPADVKVQLGATETTLAGELPDIEVREPELEDDAISGQNWRGITFNNTGEQHERLLIYGVARRGGKVVAAGRAALEEMKPDKPLVYRVYIVGDPQGVEPEITSYPTLKPD